jgi:hypothetical protein
MPSASRDPPIGYARDEFEPQQNRMAAARRSDGRAVGALGGDGRAFGGSAACACCRAYLSLAR